MANKANKEKDTGRSAKFATWHYFIFAVVIHATVVLALSPRLLGIEDNSPEALIQRARSLSDSEKYEEAIKLYERVLAQRPAIPKVFLDAEDELQDARRFMLELAAARADEEKKEAEKIEEEGEAPGIAPGDDLPDLPDF